MVVKDDVTRRQEIDDVEFSRHIHSKNECWLLDFSNVVQCVVTQWTRIVDLLNMLSSLSPISAKAFFNRTFAELLLSIRSLFIKLLVIVSEITRPLWVFLQNSLQSRCRQKLLSCFLTLCIVLDEPL